MGGAKDPRRREKEGHRDLVLISGVDPDRKEVHVLKPVQEGVEAAVLRPVEEGKPIQGDLVRLRPREDVPVVAELETLMRHPDHPDDPRRRHKGPPMVASEAYRQGWEMIFGARPAPETDKEAN